MANFQERVINLVKKIPKGKISTYKLLAQRLGNKNLARAVGNALNKNQKLMVVPCHRIVKSSGALGGYKLGAKKKADLLAREGVKTKNSRILNFSDYLYKF